MFKVDMNIEVGPRRMSISYFHGHCSMAKSNSDDRSHVMVEKPKKHQRNPLVLVVK